MLRAARPSPPARPRGAPGWLLALVLAPLLLVAGAAPPPQGVELTSFEVRRTDEGLLLGYTVEFELSRPAEEALAKSVPLYFVAEAAVLRHRWYWSDKRVAHATRTWRIVYLPLTASWRVTFGDLAQTYPTQAEALAAVRRAVDWRIAEPGQLEDGASHYVDFVFRLDTTQLPRPMQIGLAALPEWTLAIERTQPVP